MVTARTFSAIVLLALSTGAGAQWSSVSEANPGDGAVHASALVHNNQGASLRVFLNSARQLVGEFKLGPGLLSLDSATCPTLQIDTNPPEDLNLAQHQCKVSGAGARFTLTQVSDGQLESKTFLTLMNGSRLVVRYRLHGAGYGRQFFSLKGSKQVLKSTLDHGTVVVGD